MKAPSLSSKRVLVTGGSGFLGSHLMEALQQAGAKEIVAPRSREVDLRDALAVDRLFSNTRFDLVFHLAASVGGIGANQKRPADFFRDNALMGIHILEAAARTGVGRLIQLGTICAYPKFAPIPFREESLWDGYPEETNAPYGLAKRTLLVGAQSYMQQYGLNFVAVFPTNLYGPRDNFDLETSHVISALIRKCETAKATGQRSITLWGTGKATRDFLYVEDAVQGILKAATVPGIEGEVLNIGSGQEISILDLAHLIQRCTDFQGELVWDSSRPDGQPRRCVSSERARAKINFVPEVNLEEGIRRTVAWYRQNAART